MSHPDLEKVGVLIHSGLNVMKCMLCKNYFGSGMIRGYLIAHNFTMKPADVKAEVIPVQLPLHPKQQQALHPSFAWRSPCRNVACQDWPCMDVNIFWLWWSVANAHWSGQHTEQTPKLPLAAETPRSSQQAKGHTISSPPSVTKLCVGGPDIEADQWELLILLSTFPLIKQHWTQRPELSSSPNGSNTWVQTHWVQRRWTTALRPTVPCKSLIL